MAIITNVSIDNLGNQLKDIFAAHPGKDVEIQFTNRVIHFLVTEPNFGAGIVQYPLVTFESAVDLELLNAIWREYDGHFTGYLEKGASL